MAALELFAPSKLNLVLRVGPLGRDGYHPLRSLMVALSEPHDRVTVATSAQRRVECVEAPGPENLAWAALDALEARVGRALGVVVRIEKGIPSQAGLGGGSSDAAAVLRAANALHDCRLSERQLEEVGAEVGSDVPFFVAGGVQWAAGRGERLRPAPVPADLHVVIVDAGIRLSTGAVYDAFDRVPRTPLRAHADAPPVNDLWGAALALRPALGRMARDLRAAGATAALLCGSGGAMAGLFDDHGSAVDAVGSLGGRYRVWRAQPHTAAIEGG